MSNDAPASEVFAKYQAEAEKLALSAPYAAGLLLGLLGIARSLEREVLRLSKPAEPSE